MFNKRVQEALARVASLSSESAEIVKSLTGSAPDSTVEVATLQATIQRLQKEISELRLSSLVNGINNDHMVTEHEFELLRQALFTHLNGVENVQAALANYGRTFFLQYSSLSVRVAIATVLISYCTENQLTFNPMWSELIANSGVL
jgi:hypothetical protein